MHFFISIFRHLQEPHSGRFAGFFDSLPPTKNMIIIETDGDPCDAQFDYPITNEDIDTLINTDFAHVLRMNPSRGSRG